MTFQRYKIEEEIIKALSMMGYERPTRVQEEVIQKILTGQDVIVKSKTGSGKTASFVIPICHEIDWEENLPQALILAPTRELAIQIKEDVFHIGRFKRIKTFALYGKYPFERQRRELKQKNHVLVATPGRLLDHIERGTVDLSKIRFLIVDEADELLKMGFIEQVEEIIKKLPSDRLTALFSATMPSEIQTICENHLKNPVFVEIQEEDHFESIEQWWISIEKEDKFGVLMGILALENPDSGMIFCNTRQEVDWVYDKLKRETEFCVKLHGDMLQKDRTKIMKEFKRGKYRILVTTDVSARGIDVDKMDVVINYDLPMKTETYIHRIGRTGRIGNFGKAFSLYREEEKDFLTELEKEKKITCKEFSFPDATEMREKTELFLEKWKEKPKEREQKTKLLNEEIIKLHINAGRKTKMRPVDVVGTLCAIEGITAEDIGVINILEVSTFVEILNGKGELVKKALQQKPIKGRIRKVTIKREE